MFDFGLSASHILVIVVLAVIAIGPKDLPLVLRRFGQFMNKMRGMARDFQGHVDAAMKDAGMEDVHKDLQMLKSGVGAAMNPVHSMVSTAALSAADTPSPSRLPNVTAPVDQSSNRDFASYFHSGGTGETRVQGRAVGEAAS